MLRLSIDSYLPVSFSSAILLGFLWVDVDVTMLAEELWKHWLSRLLVLVPVNAITEFVRASHCQKMLVMTLEWKA